MPTIDIMNPIFVVCSKTNDSSEVEQKGEDFNFLGTHRQETSAVQI